VVVKPDPVAKARLGARLFSGGGGCSSTDDGVWMGSLGFVHRFFFFFFFLFD
jgi:hypothetical protein